MPESTTSEWIPPMKAVIGMPPDDTGWVAELKWDGIRTQVSTDGERTTIRSSTGREITRQFPELHDFGAQLGAPAVLDGEIVVFDGDRPSFNRVLNRLNVDRPTALLVETHPVVFIAFDLLALDGRLLLELPYRNRRAVLEDFVGDGPSWRVPPSVLDGTSELLALAEARELEGIVLKRPDSIYRPGSRSSEWRKVKIRLRQEFVVGGWLVGQGALEREIGSLVVGVWDGSELVAAGSVGSGLTEGERARLAARFIERATTPFVEVPPLERRPTWVEPEVVVEIEYGDWPADGMLRHPTYIGMRVDHDPTAVVREHITGAGSAFRPDGGDTEETDG